MSYAWLNELNAKQPKAAAHDLAINTDGMCEKEELIAAVRASPKRGKLVKKNVLAPDYCGRIQKKVVDREKKISKTCATVVIGYETGPFVDDKCYKTVRVHLRIDKKKTVDWLSGAIYKLITGRREKLSNVALRVFPGASSIFNPLTAKTHYDNPTEHGLSGQPYLLNDGDTLEGVGFPTRGHVYLRVEYTLY